ncbi:hypothetical protein ES703_21802 [subsurface metagenome]
MGFARNGSYDPSCANPLAALVTNDVNRRLLIAVISDPGAALDTNGDDLAIAATDAQESQTQKKWRRFIKLAAVAPGELSIASVPAEEIDDLRIAPLLKTRWDQQTCYVEQYDVNGNPYMVDTRSACYNFYTPPSDPGDPCDYVVASEYSGIPGTYGDPNNYPCGCVATAMAQLMRYHQWPQEGIGKNEFDIQVKYGEQWQSEKAWTRGGDGQGGPYDWANMPAMPDCGDPNHCKAIGALCYDAGVSIRMEYGPDGSQPPDALEVLTALVRTFKYKNTIAGVNVQNNELVNIGAALTEMINPNLDARKPVILGIKGIQNEKEVGHFVICDGYGFNSSTIYYHLNMGGSRFPIKCAAVWYQLIPPDISHTCTWSACADDPNCQCPECIYIYEADWNYDSVQACIYNIFPETTGEIISGRVLDARGIPVPRITVLAESTSDPNDNRSDATDPNGIFAFVGCQADTGYLISAELPDGNYLIIQVQTGTSKNRTTEVGNVWNLELRDLRPLFVPDDYPTIQAAVDVAVDGQPIVVRPGTYSGDGNRDIDFKGKTITVQSEYPSDPCVVAATVIDCQGTADDHHRGFYFHRGETHGSFVSGLTVTNGYHENGGAIYCTRSSPIIMNCIFRNNSAVSHGGAFYNHDSDPLIMACTFSDNSVGVPGGTVGDGGAIFNSGSSPQIINSLFTRNSAQNSGGALYSKSFSRSQMCSSGEIGCTPRSYPVCLRWVRDAFTGAMHCAKWVRETVWKRDVTQASHPELRNCTLMLNSSTKGAALDLAAGSMTLENCIVWDNSPEQVSTGTGVTVSYSDVQRGFDGEGNIDADPLFANPDNGDYHLKSQAGRWDRSSQSWLIDDVTSPCIDAGDPSSPIGDEPSPNGGIINMGAYGGTAEASKSSAN